MIHFPTGVVSIIFWCMQCLTATGQTTSTPAISEPIDQITITGSSDSLKNVIEQFATVVRPQELTTASITVPITVALVVLILATAYVMRLPVSPQMWVFGVLIILSICTIGIIVFSLTSKHILLLSGWILTCGILTVSFPFFYNRLAKQTPALGQGIVKVQNSRASLIDENEGLLEFSVDVTVEGTNPLQGLTIRLNADNGIYSLPLNEKRTILTVASGEVVSLKHRAKLTNPLLKNALLIIFATNAEPIVVSVAVPRIQLQLPGIDI